MVGPLRGAGSKGRTLQKARKENPKKRMTIKLEGVRALVVGPLKNFLRLPLRETKNYNHNKKYNYPVL